MTTFCKGVRAGDEWVFQTNSGGISRTITGFDDELVYYRSYGDPYEKSCKASTFNRWLKGARLEFRRPDASGVKGIDQC
jgi:hypothetical protein